MMVNLDWKFWVGDVVIPIVTFLIGLFVGRKVERKANAKVRGNNNTVIQNSRVDQ